MIKETPVADKFYADTKPALEIAEKKFAEEQAEISKKAESLVVKFESDFTKEEEQINKQRDEDMRRAEGKKFDGIRNVIRTKNQDINNKLNANVNNVLEAICPKPNQQ